MTREFLVWVNRLDEETGEQEQPGTVAVVVREEDGQLACQVATDEVGNHPENAAVVAFVRERLVS